MGNLWQDVKYGVRMLRKNPGFTAVTVLTLALGIGATTAIFSVVNAVLLRPLPYREPSRLVWITEAWPRLKGQTLVPNPDYQYWHTQSRLLEDVEGYAGGGNYVLTGNGEPTSLEGAMVTVGFFHLLGVEPLQGRSFLPEECRPGGRHAVILSHGFWQRRFGSDPNILGKAITLNDEPYSVVGIMPVSFQFPDKTLKPEVFVPFALPPPDWSAKDLNAVSTVGRLKRDANIEQVRSELFTINQQHNSELSPVFTRMREGLQIIVTTLHDKLVGDVRRGLLVLFGAVAFVLLIACANIANLQLVRTAERRKEFAVRTAVGGERGALIRQLLTESVLLAGLGGAAGLLFAISATGFLRAYVPTNISLAGNISVDRGVLLFALVITCFTGVLFGMAPAIGASRPDISAVLKEGGGKGGQHRRATRSVLVISELALTLMLLACSGLLIRSFVLLSNVRLGMDPSNLLTVHTTLPRTKYSQPQERQSFFAQVLARLRSLPGVQSVASTSALPLTALTLTASVAIDGEALPLPGLSPSVHIEQISPDYFRTLRIPLLDGRFFDDGDSKQAASAAIVNAAFTRRFFAGEEAVGKRIRFGDQTGPWTSIVGVTGDVRHSGPAGESEPEAYIPYSGGRADSYLVIRTDGDPLAMARTVRTQVESVDPEQPISDIATMNQRLADTLETPRFNALLLGELTCLALVLAAVGIFGVIAYFVSQRTHEIAVRVALGASPANVLRLVLRQGLVMTLLGVGLGLAGSLAVTRYLGSLLFEIGPRDPLTFAGVAVLLAFISLAACYIPARRAMRVDPIVALRHE